MKRIPVLLCFFILVTSKVIAQPYDISNAEFDYYDENRDQFVNTFVYYPSVIDENNTETFPYVVFGHGFSMSYASYSYLWEHLVPRGYIVVLPNTETGVIGVSHGDFGNDLGFLAGYFYENSLDSESLFHNQVQPYPAVIGHSMGGGATHLASESYTGDIQTAISFAAAETDPSAIDAAANADLPLYVFYGENDAVSPPAENQIAIYNTSNSSCKTLINVLGGGHCFFADEDWVCDVADGSETAISREEQHDITLDFLDLILDYELQNDNQALATLEDSLENSGRINSTRECITSFMLPNPNDHQHQNTLQNCMYPNPAEGFVYIRIKQESRLTISDTSGKVVKQNKLPAGIHRINLCGLPTGTYHITVSGKAGTYKESGKLIIQAN